MASLTGLRWLYLKLSVEFRPHKASVFLLFIYVQARADCGLPSVCSALWSDHDSHFNAVSSKLVSLDSLPDRNLVWLETTHITSQDCLTLPLSSFCPWAPGKRLRFQFTFPESLSQALDTGWQFPFFPEPPCLCLLLSLLTKGVCLLIFLRECIIVDQAGLELTKHLLCLLPAG